MHAEYDVSVIIPTLRAGDDLRECLKSISADSGAIRNEVVVVINNPAISGRDFREYHQNARSIEAGTNLGFAAGCNLGARAAVGKTLVFLNDDMTVRRGGWMDNLTTPILTGESSATGGQIISADGKKIDFAGGSINLLGWGFQTGHEERVQASGENDFAPRRTLPFACGGNFAISADLYEKSGGFDDDYFAYYEDVDLGWRLRLMGHEIGYVSDAVTMHASGSTGQHMAPALKWFLQERNALQTIVRNYSDEILIRILPVAFAMVGVRAMVLSGLEASDVAPDRMWREWVLGEDNPPPGEKPGMWRGIMDNVRESIKSGMKASRKSTLPDGYLPIENRGAAGLLALEWCMNNWERLFEKRAHVQAMRTKSDREILGLFDDPMRPVLGHPREVEAMKPLEGILNDLMRG